MKYLIGILAALLLLATLGGLSSCKHEPILIGDDPTIPVDTSDVNDPDTTTMGEPCDPDLIYFDQDVLPILVSNCALSGCHDTATAQDGVVLTSYTSVMQSGEIDPGDLDGSDLYEVLTEDDPDKRMPPPPNQPLTNEQINQIAEWILDGAVYRECDPNAGGCDTTDVSFAATVFPILENNCMGCHSGGNPSGGLSLTNYTQISAVASDGRLYGVIAHEPGYPPMPQNGNQLSQCTIDQIAAWIEQGAPNN